MPSHNTYRDMHLLDELARRPEITQRELSRRIGVALGLTNLMLRRLVKKGYLKISGTTRNRIRYLITPTGILEKSRLMYEYIEYSLQYYRSTRTFLVEQLLLLSEPGHRKILLFGAGELAEITYLTLRELGLEFVGMVADEANGKSFLNYATKDLSEMAVLDFDQVVITSLKPRWPLHQSLIAAGVPAHKILVLPDPRMDIPGGSGQEMMGTGTVLRQTSLSEVS